MRETFTDAFSCGSGSLALGVDVSGMGELVVDGVISVGVSVLSIVSVIVGLLV